MAIIASLAQNDLTASQASAAEDIFHFNGQYYRRADAVKDFQPVFDSVQDDLKAAHESTTYQSSTPAGRKLDDMSVWSWIESRVPGGHRSSLGQFLDVAFTVEYGADTTEQRALTLVYTLSGSDHSFEIYGTSDERFHIQGGNQKLPESIADYLLCIGSPVHTGVPMTALREASDGRYRLAFEKGGSHTEVLADLVVLTIPFAVMRTLDRSGAGFDVLKEEVIQNLGRALSIPHHSPLFNCAYSYWKVGQYQRFTEYEEIRQKNVFFAGEHTSLNYQGFMEGATHEGQRAAQEILNQIGL